MSKAPKSNQLSPIGLQILWNRLIGVVEEQARSGALPLRYPAIEV